MKVFDSEVYPDCFLFVFKEYGKREYDVFVQSSLDLGELKLKKSITIHPIGDINKYFHTRRKLAGYNNTEYDNQILMYVLTGESDPKAIYEYSDFLIKESRFKGKFYKDYPDKVIAKYFDYLDLLKVNHYDFKGRMCSLKKLEFNYRRKSIKDLPFPMGTPVNTIKRLSDLILYCCEDTDVTEMCYDHSKAAIDFRILLTSEYRKMVPNFSAMNWSDVKIGDYENLFHYCLATGLTENQVRKSVPNYSDDTIYYKDCIPDFVSFRTKELQSFYNLFLQRSVKVKSLEEDAKSAKKATTTIVQFDGVEYTIAMGGIHSKDPARIIRSNETHVLIDADASSQYPSEIIKRMLHPRHLGPEWCRRLSVSIRERITKWKPLAGTDPYAKAMAERIKLSANGGAYGKLKEKYSWQYDPQIALSVTLSCQLQILMLIEMLYLDGITTVSANTDGILVWVERVRLNKFYEVCAKWEEITLNQEVGKLEFSECNFIAQTAGNDYIVQKSDGKLKRKGDFIIYEDIVQDNWHKDSSARIIPLALQEYFVNDVDPGRTINSCNNIHEFCLGVPKTKAFNWLISTLNSNGVISSSINRDRFIRYFIGGNTSISKDWLDKDGLTLVEATTPVTLAQHLGRDDIIRAGNNKYPTLDREWYISEARTIINQIEGKNNHKNVVKK